MLRSIIRNGRISVEGDPSWRCLFFGNVDAYVARHWKLCIPNYDKAGTSGNFTPEIKTIRDLVNKATSKGRGGNRKPLAEVLVKHAGSYCHGQGSALSARDNGKQGVALLEIWDTTVNLLVHPSRNKFYWVEDEQLQDALHDLAGDFQLKTATRQLARASMVTQGGVRI